jgi:hypothetical protein
MTDDDPLEGADIGETVEIEREVDLAPINYEPLVTAGFDRDGDISVDAAVTTDSDGEEVIRLTYSGELTKQLPPNALEAAASPADAGEPSRRRDRVLGALQRVAGPFVGISVTLAVWAYVSNNMIQSLDGTTVELGQAPTLGVAEVGVMVCCMLVLVYAMQWAPGYVERGVSR